MLTFPRVFCCNSVFHVFTQYIQGFCWSSIFLVSWTRNPSMHHMRLFLVVWFSPLLDLTIRFIAALILNSIHARGNVHMRTHTSLHAYLSQMYLLLLLSSFIQHSASYKAGLTFVLKETLLLKVALYNGLNIHFFPFCPPCRSFLQCPLKNLYFVLLLLF